MICNLLLPLMLKPCIQLPFPHGLTFGKITNIGY
jgi:hypothetical protein